MTEHSEEFTFCLDPLDRTPKPPPMSGKERAARHYAKHGARTRAKQKTVGVRDRLVQKGTRTAAARRTLVKKSLYKLSFDSIEKANNDKDEMTRERLFGFLDLQLADSLRDGGWGYNNGRTVTLYNEIFSDSKIPLSHVFGETEYKRYEKFIKSHAKTANLIKDELFYLATRPN